MSSCTNLNTTMPKIHVKHFGTLFSVTGINIPTPALACIYGMVTGVIFFFYGTKITPSGIVCSQVKISMKKDLGKHQ